MGGYTADTTRKERGGEKTRQDRDGGGEGRGEEEAVVGVFCDQNLVCVFLFRGGKAGDGGGGNGVGGTVEGRCLLCVRIE